MNLDSLIPQVILEAPEIPDISASSQLVLSARELCTTSLAWQADLTIQLSGRSVYSLIPVDGEIAEPVSAVFSESSGGTTSDIRASVPARLDLEDPSWRSRIGRPLWYFMPDQESVRLVPNPSTGSAIFRVALQPTIQDRIIDDRVGNIFREGIVHGALWRLFRMPRREWSDVSRATYYETLYERALAQAQTRGVDGFAKISRKVRYGGL